MLEIAIILISAFVLRLYGISWDAGHHLHPDERMLIMVADRINFFKNLNPDFFNYGSLPVYILKGLTQISDFIFKSSFNTYDGMLLFGRSLSISFDLLTVILIYKISQLLFKNKKLSLIASFLYGIAFFPIQNSHFFVVDVFLTMLTSLLCYLLLLFFESREGKNNLANILLISMTFAAMMATKFTAIIFFPIIILTIIFKEYKNIKKLFLYLFVSSLISGFCYFLFMPYAFIDHLRFTSDLASQLRMNSNPYIFPYTLQYVATIPYLYYLKNIFIWGLGPFISIIFLIGLIGLMRLIGLIGHISKERLFKYKSHLLFLGFYLLYFLIVGRSAVKFMRYMLPLYPFFTILAAYGIYRIKKSRFKILSYFIILLAVFWTFMFVNIYSQVHTRNAATNWIIKNIPSQKTLAIEHWDDKLPLVDSEKYQFQELTLYDQPDDNNKWEILNDKIKKSDYIIIASNRLYIPLSKLADCNKFESCYPMTAQYYQKLFSGKLGFKKVVEFTNYPAIQLGHWRFEIKDDNADESFTVYDHPKIMIFKKTNVQ